MTSRVPSLNFVIPFLILYPIPNNAFWGNQGKFLLSLLIFGFIYYFNVEILKCRLRRTKFLLIFLGIFLAFSRTEMNFLVPQEYQSEIIASINSNHFYQTKNGHIHKAVKIRKIQESKARWQGKDVVIEDQFGLLNKAHFEYGTLTAKGIIYKNELNLPTFTVNRIIKIKNRGSFKSFSNRKDALIENLWNNSKASTHTKSFIIAFTTGSKRYIDTVIKDIYIRTGVMHFFAVSGLHFGILYFFLKFMIDMLPFHKLFKSFLVISLLFFYLGFIGFSYSAQRAFLMILTWEITNLLLRRKCAVSALSFSFIITCLLQPESLFEPGFQLSFTIVLIIIWFSKSTFIFNDNKLFFTYLLGFVKCSCGAFCGSFFILLGSFSQIVPISIISNIILIPFAFPLMIAFLLYILNFYLFNIDLYFILDIIYFLILELLLLLNKLPISYFYLDLEVNAYLYIVLPLFIMYFYNKKWNFFKKLGFSFFVSLFTVLCVICL